MVNNNINKNFILIAFFFTLIFLLASCKTEINTQIERPAILDVRNSATVSVMHFKGTSEMAKILDDGTYDIQLYRNIDSSLTSNALKVDDEQRITTALTESLMNYFEKTGRFSVIPARIVTQAKKDGEKPPADLIITGGLTYFGTSFQQEQKQTTDKKGNNVKRTTFYWRDITLLVMYSVFDTKTNTLLDNREVKYTVSSEKTRERAFVPEASDMAIDKVKELAKSIVKDFMPYTEDITFLLLFHKDTEMKTATTNAQLGKIDIAIEQFKKIYTNKGYFEAGYNRAKLFQVQGDLTNAYLLMAEVYDKFKDGRAEKALKVIEEEISSKKKLQSQQIH